jgi:L-fuconolactonase
VYKNKQWRKLKSMIGMKIDAHQHFWKYNPEQHSWINPSMRAIRHDFQPTDITNILAQNNIDGTVLVQVDQTLAENDMMLALAEKHDFIKAIVAWVNFADPKLEHQLEQYKQKNIIKGYRHILQAENTADFLKNEAFLNGISLLEKYNFTYDVLIYHHQLTDALSFVKRFPNQKFVLDHIAKPDIANAQLKTWAAQLKEIGKQQNLYCKLSGMVTQNHWNLWNEADFDPYMQTALEAFGSERLMFGSDWPVCMLAAAYSQVHDIVHNFCSTLSNSEQSNIWGKTAQKFYNIA